MSDESLPMLSRSAGLAPELGKCTNRLTTNLPDDVFDDVTKHCRKLGIDPSTWLRLKVMEALYGSDFVLRMQEDSLRRALGMSTDEALNSSSMAGAAEQRRAA